MTGKLSSVKLSGNSIHEYIIIIISNEHYPVCITTAIFHKMNG